MWKLLSTVPLIDVYKRQALGGTALLITPKYESKAQLYILNKTTSVTSVSYTHLDDRVEARQSILDAYPGLKKMYAADDGNTEVFYFKNGVATISAFTHEPKVIKF